MDMPDDLAGRPTEVLNLLTDLDFLRDYAT